MEVGPFEPPGRADGIIRKFGRLAGRVPTPRDLLEGRSLVAPTMTLEPCFLDHAAAGRSWALLVLASEIEFPNGCADIGEGFERLAGLMQGGAGAALEPATPQRRLDVEDLASFGDRRERDDFKSLLLQNAPGQVVLVQALHDDDDRALGLVVEAGIERAVEPVVGRPTPACGHRVRGFQRIVDQDQLGLALPQLAPLRP